MGKSPKLKVGLVFDDSLDSNDGVAQHVKLLGSWLNSQGHKVSYLVGETHLSEWAGGQVYSLAHNQTVYFNGNRLSIPLLASKKRIRQVLDDGNFDVLHVMMPYSPFMAQRVIKLAGPDTAVVGTFHIFPSGPIADLGSRLLKLAYGRSLKRFLTVVSVSEAAAGFAKDAFGLTTPVIPNPVDVARFRAAQKKSESKKSTKQIVFLGRLVKRKGAEQLIRAFAATLSEFPDLHLKIAGSGPSRKKLEKLSRDLGLEEEVEFLGYIDEADKPALLAGADIACFPSLYGESFGIVLIEAMAAGAKTVVGGDNPGYRSVLSGQPVLLVDPRNTPLFAERLKQLLSNKKLQETAYAWQQQTVKQYDINVVGTDVLSVYKMAIARLNKTSHNKPYG